MWFRSVERVKEQQGATVVMVALLLLILIGVAALAIDVGHLLVVRNELQNAADAGCLAGTRVLYSYTDGALSVDENANQIANQAAIANRSEKLPVEVHWNGGNTGDVERGHWSFAPPPTFTPRGSTQPVKLWDVLIEELDANPDFINAIRVKARRQDIPAASFFARIFGYEHFFVGAEAIAYLGYAGTLGPKEVRQPLAICKESVLANGQYSCFTGRMIDFGEQVGGWSDFNQDSPCLNGTNAETVRSLACGDGNPGSILVKRDIATNGGDIPVAFETLRSCWESATGRSQAWTLMLPVIDCEGYTVGPCAKVLGAVTINIVWITGATEGATEDPSYSHAPTVMEDRNRKITWSSNDPNGQVRWDSFVQHFNLRTVDGSPAPYQEKSIFFTPDCNYHEPAGRTGGENFGVLAKIPVLVTKIPVSVQ